MSVTSSISVSELAAFRSGLSATFDRPSMYGLDRRYAVMTAYLVGCDVGTKGALLDGFSAWLIRRHRSDIPERNVTWEGLIVRLRRPDLIDSYRTLDEEQSAPLVSFLRDQVDLFLEERVVASVTA